MIEELIQIVPSTKEFTPTLLSDDRKLPQISTSHKACLQIWKCPFVFNITRPVSWLWGLELFVHFCGFVCLTLKNRKGILTGMKFRGRKFYTLLALNQQQIKGSIKRRWSSIKILFIYLGTWVRYANVSPSLLTLKSSVFPAGIVKILRPWRSLPPVIRSTQIKAVNLIHLNINRQFYAAKHNANGVTKWKEFITDAEFYINISVVVLNL